MCCLHFGFFLVHACGVTSNNGLSSKKFYDHTGHHLARYRDKVRDISKIVLITCLYLTCAMNP